MILELLLVPKYKEEPKIDEDMSKVQGSKIKRNSSSQTRTIRTTK